MKTLDGEHICDVDDDIVIVDGDEYILHPIDIDNPSIINVRGIKEQAAAFEAAIKSVEIEDDPEDESLAVLTIPKEHEEKFLALLNVLDVEVVGAVEDVETDEDNPYI